jgi:hypothetical protein
VVGAIAVRSSWWKRWYGLGRTTSLPSQSILTVSGLGGRAAAVNAQQTKRGEFSGLLSVSMPTYCVEDKREELTLWLAASIATGVRRSSGAETGRTDMVGGYDQQCSE